VDYGAKGTRLIHPTKCSCKLDPFLLLTALNSFGIVAAENNNKWIVKTTMKPQHSTLLIKSYFIITILCLGKIFGATGQTLFNVHNALDYISESININFFINFASIFAAVCTLFIVSITRTPAIHRQFHSKILPEFNVKIDNSYRKIFYYFLIVSNIASGVFSSAGAYLGTFTLIEFVSHLANHPLLTTGEMVLSQSIAIFFALSSFVAFYSFNIYKAKINSVKLANMNKKNSKDFFNKIAFKTAIVSMLNILSLPFISYFLTKHALHKMPCVLSYFSFDMIKYIASFAAITALISSLTTTVAAMHEYFSKEKVEVNRESTFMAVFRYVTYTTGIVDCSASGLGTFLGVVTISNDLFLASNKFIILAAVGSALSSALLIFSFSVRQGFNDLIDYMQNRKVVSYM